MFHPMVKRSIPVAISAAMLVGTAPTVATYAATAPAKPAAAANTAFAPAAIGKVSLGGGSYIEVRDVQQLGQTVRFSLAVVNNGVSDLQFINYWVKLRSVNGSQYTVHLTGKDKDKNRIAAKTTETFTFYSTVGEKTKLSDLKFDLIKWDFSAPSFQRFLGSARVPATYTNVTPAGKKLSMQITGNKASAFIKRATVAKNSEEYAANLSFVIENTGSKSFVIPAYEYSIVTSEGLSYPLTVSNLSENTSVHPRFTKEITLKGQLPATVSKNGWKLVLTEKAGEESALLLPVASFLLPASSAAEVVKSIPVNGKKELTISDQKVNAHVVRTVRNENDRNYLAAITFSFVNEGTKPVTLPKYTFAVETSSGLTYPITVTMDNIRLDPRVDKEIELKATLPNSVGKLGWKLVMEEPSDASKPDSPTTEIASFDLPNDNPTGLNQGSTYTYSNDAGSYEIKFDSVQRLPWEDEDILSAELIVKNPGKTSLPIPELTGYFMLDDKIRIDAKALQKDTVIDVKPDGTIHMTLYSKIPYTYEYSKLKVTLQEKTGEDTAVNVVEFSNDGDIKELPVIALNAVHKIDGVGRTSEISMRNVRTYDGVDSILYTSQVDVKNMEKRYSNTASLVGHFKTTDGLMFPAKITEIKNKVAPLGVASLIVSTSLPKTVNTKDLELILGEGVTDGKLSSGGTSDAYVNAVAFQLPVEIAEPKKELSDMSFYPYTLSMNNVSAKVIEIGKFVFKFDYVLTKNNFVEIPEDKHSIILEFKDPNGGVAFNEELLFEEGSTEKKLTPGNNKLELPINDELIFYKLNGLKAFTVEIYDKFMGEKKLIAKQQFEWNQ